MDEYITIQESKEIIWRITQEIIPSANKIRSGKLLKTFRDMYFPTMETSVIARKVMADPQEFVKFLETKILRENKLEEGEFRHLLNQVDKLSLEQIDILLNKVLLNKSDILRLISKNTK